MTPILIYAVLAILALAALINIYQGFRNMSTIDDLQSTESDLESKVDALLTFAAQQQANVATLSAQLAAAGNTDPAVEAVVAKMQFESAKIAAFLLPPSNSPPGPAAAPAAVPSAPVIVAGSPAAPVAEPVPAGPPLDPAIVPTVSAVTAPAA